MKVTRRELAATLAGAAVRPSQASQAETPDQLLKASVAEMERDSASVARLEVSMDTEPAFSFRA